jgi:hypothetical protein
MKWLAEKLNFKSMEDWYTVTNATFIENNGGGLLQHYEHSCVKGTVLSSCLY